MNSSVSSSEAVDFLDLRGYGSYHAHAMEGFISIQSFDVVINIVCNILDKLR